MMDQIFTWNTLWWVLMCIYVPLTLSLVGLVLLQQGKGGGLGGALGGGGGDNVFGAKSAQTMPVKLTYIGAGTFIFLCIALSIVSGRTTQGLAPELANVTDESATDDSVTTGELDDLGFGTGVVNKNLYDGTAVVPPVVIPDETPEVTTTDTPDELSVNTPDQTPVTEEESTDTAE